MTAAANVVAKIYSYANVLNDGCGTCLHGVWNIIEWQHVSTICFDNGTMVVHVAFSKYSIFNYSIEHNFHVSMLGKFSFIYTNHYFKTKKSCLITFQEHSNSIPRTRMQIAPPTRAAKLFLKMQLLIVRLDPNYSQTHKK